MSIQDVIVLSNKEISEGTILLEVDAGNLFNNLRPGQFFNIQVTETLYPLLRRPFSICDVEGSSLYFMYKVVGEGTKIMSELKSGEKINLLGPLGNSFVIDNNIDHHIIIGGGIGIAPFPFLIRQFSDNQKYSVLFGVRNKNEAHEYGLKNIHYSSDDGTIGFHGNTVQLLEKHLAEIKSDKIKIFACGPNPMLKALKKLALENNIECEVSMESAMACGFGICQGCPIEYKDEESYKLICKDGPIFNVQDITI